MFVLAGCYTGPMQPPGWYPDPYGRRPYRWWDGEQWTAYAGAETVDWDPTEPDQPDALPAAPKAIGVAAAGFVAGLAATVAATEALDDESVAVQMGLSALALWTGLIAAWLLVRLRARDSSIDFRFRWSDVGFGLAGSLVGRVLAGVAISPVPFPDQRLRDLDDGVASESLSGTGWIVLILVTCVGAPLVEEIFFRGLVQRRLVSRLGVVPGIVIASVLFGAAHLIGWEGPLSLASAWAIAAAGGVLGVLYHLTGRLGTAIAAHAWFNAQAMLVIALFG